MYVTKPYFLWLSSLSGFASATSSPPNRCKALPDTPSWPSAQEWSILNKQLGGRLITPTPPAAACHSGQAAYNDTQCAIIRKGWTTQAWHTKDPVSVMWDHYTNDTCLPDPKMPCSPKGYPSYVVNASIPEHVKLGVDFARKHKVRLIVKTTGHDFMGRSIAPGALSIWTHSLNNIEYHSAHFELSGSGKLIPGDAVTVGGGTQMYDIFSATHKRNRTVVGGAAKEVGISGYISGGGHSILAPRYGLGADQVLEMQVVTPGGEILTVNEDRNADLFWALRGGGGSTFGVITSVTVKTHPSPKILDVTFAAFIKPNSTYYSEILTYLISQAPYLMDAGFSGYTHVTYNTSKPIPIPGMPDRISGWFGKVILQDAKGEQDVADIFKPINETLKHKWPGEAGIYSMAKPYDSFLDWYNVNFDAQEAGTSFYLGSWLLDAKTLTTTSPKLTKALMGPIPYNSEYSIFLVAGKGVINAKPRGGGNAVNSAFRNAHVFAVAAVAFPKSNNTARLETIDTLQKMFQPMRDVAPNSGTYINEGLPFEKNFQKTFWGSNYDRLLKIKRKVDPTDVFWCTPCVGNERWQEGEDGRLCMKK